MTDKHDTTAQLKEHIADQLTEATSVTIEPGMIEMVDSGGDD